MSQNLQVFPQISKDRKKQTRELTPLMLDISYVHSNSLFVIERGPYFTTLSQLQIAIIADKSFWIYRTVCGLYDFQRVIALIGEIIPVLGKIWLQIYMHIWLCVYIIYHVFLAQMYFSYGILTKLLKIVLD